MKIAVVIEIYGERNVDLDKSISSEAPRAGT